MNRRAKCPKPSLKAKRGVQPTLEGTISITLKYLSENKSRNFDYFSLKDLRAREQAQEAFLKLIQRLTAKTRLEISSLSKNDDCGFEIIPFEQLNCKPAGLNLGKDAKICVFRFGAGNAYRALGFFEERQSVLNIIGFDFDFSAYSHGQ